MRDRREVGLFFERGLGRDSTTTMPERLRVESRTWNRRIYQQVNCSDNGNSRRLWRLGVRGQIQLSGCRNCYEAIT